jgi:predicted NAD/FAD-dependent oxidoreductase
MTAAALRNLAHQISLVDKGRSVGGRMATRRLGAGRADHGAQFFTTRTPEFRTWVDGWVQAGAVFTWSNGWSNGSLDSAAADGHPRYAVHGGMNALAKLLAADIAQAGAAVHTGVQLQAISRTDDGWWACSEDGRVYTAQVLVLTAPVPQSLALLHEGSVLLNANDAAQLARITYAPSLCALLHFDTQVSLPTPGALQRPHATIPWLADNRTKGISPNATVLTAHASPEFSNAHFDDADNQIINAFLAELAPLLNGAPAPIEVQIKRWRYALPTTLHGARFLRAADLPPLYFGGDAFGGPRIEGAALSGLAIAAALAAIGGENAPTLAPEISAAAPLEIKAPD